MLEYFINGCIICFLKQGNSLMRFKTSKSDHLNLESAVSTFAFFMLAIMALLPPIILFTFANSLKYWWLILLFGYYGFLSWVLWYIMNRRKMREARMYLGNELYYQRYPSERRRDERIAKIRNMMDSFIFRNKR